MSKKKSLHASRTTSHKHPSGGWRLRNQPVMDNIEGNGATGHLFKVRLHSFIFSPSKQLFFLCFFFFVVVCINFLSLPTTLHTAQFLNFSRFWWCLSSLFREQSPELSQSLCPLQLGPGQSRPMSCLSNLCPLRLLSWNLHMLPTSLPQTIP